MKKREELDLIVGGIDDLFYQTYSPGDGMTRYKFTSRDIDYFAASGSTDYYTCLGISEALT